MLEGRKQPRARVRFLVQILAVYDSDLSELAAVENVSSAGTRLVTARHWEPGSHVILKSISEGNVWGRVRVVYCRAVSPKSFAVGLNFLIQTSQLKATKRSPAKISE